MKKEKNTVIAKPPDKIRYNYFNWGPFLLHTQITPEECQMVIRAGKKSRKKSNDYRDQLAGHLAEECALKNEREFTAWLSKYFSAYASGYNEWRGSGTMSPKFRLTTLWINYMKAGDFNPPHDHGADLSFVIYPHVPEELIKECDAFPGTMRGPGAISWFYGEGNRQCISAVHHMPKSGDLFIFPACLKHWVFPFKSDVERISVSGNILFETDSRMNYSGGLKNEKDAWKDDEVNIVGGGGGGPNFQHTKRS